MIDYGAIPNYRQISCGCCTGKATNTAPNWRLAEDKCVCWMHQDVPRGQPAHKCSVHHLNQAPSR